jgi:hypothetical protein
MRMVIGDPFDQETWRAAVLARPDGLEAVICF